MRERAISAVVIAAVVIAVFLLGQVWLTFVTIGLAVLALLAETLIGDATRRRPSAIGLEVKG